MNAIEQRAEYKKEYRKALERELSTLGANANTHEEYERAVAPKEKRVETPEKAVEPSVREAEKAQKRVESRVKKISRIKKNTYADKQEAEKEEPAAQNEKAPPEGWHAAVDPATGRTYDHNVDEGSSKWEKPHAVEKDTNKDEDTNKTVKAVEAESKPAVEEMTEKEESKLVVEEAEADTT